MKENEWMTVYLLTVNSLRIGTNNFVRLYVQATIAHKISQKGGISFVHELYLWTLHKPYMTLGILTAGYKSF